MDLNLIYATVLISIFACAYLDIPVLGSGFCILGLMALAVEGGEQ